MDSGDFCAMILFSIRKRKGCVKKIIIILLLILGHNQENQRRIPSKQALRIPEVTMALMVIN